MKYSDCYMTTGFAAQQQVECTGLVQEGMVTDMMMIVMKDAMEAEMKIETVMAEKENGAIGMMTGTAEMGTLIVMGIVMAETMKIAMEEMVTGMMTTVEEVKMLMMTNMAQEVEALTEIETVHMMMMVKIHLGMYILLWTSN